MIAWLQRALDDERLKPRAARERHPIADDFPADPLVEIHLLKCQTARLWDQVWWLSLPWYQRLGWRVLGFRAPIRSFYLKPGEDWK